MQQHLYMHIAVDTAKLLGLILLLLLLSVVCLTLNRRDAASALSVITGVMLILVYLQTDFPMSMSMNADMVSQGARTRIGGQTDSPMSGMKPDMVSHGGRTRIGGHTECETKISHTPDNESNQAGEEPETVSSSDTEEETWFPHGSAGHIGGGNSAYNKIIKSASDHRYSSDERLL